MSFAEFVRPKSWSSLTAYAQEQLLLAYRINKRDRTAASDAMGILAQRLDDLRAQHDEVVVGDPAALRRLRDLERLKPTYGVEPIIHGGREAGEKTQETAGLEASGKECRRIGTCKGACPRATAGQRGGRKATC